MTEQELGQWSLVFSFVMLCAPLTVLGITGSFGRYVEHFFQRGQTRQFFLQTGTSVTALTLLMLVALLTFRHWVAWVIFGSSEQTGLIVPTCVTLVTTLAFNFFLEANIALRRIRVGSIMELISSWTFAVLGITLLFTFDWGSTGAIIAYAVGNLLGCLYGIVVLAGNWRSIPNSFESLSPIKLGRKVAPFALGLWFINIVSNLFDLVDRYMIIHFANVPAVEAQQLVGQYFSSLAIPVMMIGVGTTLAHLTMPYLSEDWEAGRQGAVSDRINFGFKLVALMLAIGATGILLVAPIVFERVFDGRYEIGQAILPISITFCCWAAISMMANNYLYCVERPRLILCATVTGLLTNVAFNAILLPVLGLFGAALATAFGWLVNLVFTLLFSIRHGLKFDRRVAIALSFPLVLPMGSAVAVLFLIPLLVISVTTNIVFTRTERVILYDIITDHLPKVPWRQVSTRAT